MEKLELLVSQLENVQANLMMKSSKRSSTSFKAENRLGAGVSWLAASEPSLHAVCCCPRAQAQ